MPRLSFDSPVARLTLVEEDGFITKLNWRGQNKSDETTELLERGKRQIDAYFAGQRIVFDLPVKPAGTDEEIAIWQAMVAIPYGETRSYGEIAKIVGSEARIVGHACGRNPIPILQPCHRVVAAEGRLGGFSAPGGVRWKEKLLVLERALLI